MVPWAVVHKFEFTGAPIGPRPFMALSRTGSFQCQEKRSPPVGPLCHNKGSRFASGGLTRSTCRDVPSHSPPAARVTRTSGLRHRSNPASSLSARSSAWRGEKENSLCSARSICLSLVIRASESLRPRTASRCRALRKAARWCVADLEPAVVLSGVARKLASFCVSGNRTPGAAGR